MKKLLLALGIFSGFAFSSTIGLDALGNEQVMGGTASAAGRGFAGNAKTGDAEGLSVINPARMAFDAKVVFNLNFSMELDEARKNGTHYSFSELSIPSFNLSFPMGIFGTTGLSLWQHYASSFSEEYENKKTSSDVKLEYQGSVYELVPTYAVRLPFFRSLSVGASAHMVMGNTSRSLTIGGDKTGLSDEDVWAAGDYIISDYVDGTWEIKDHPFYYTGALQYRGKMVSYFFSFTTGYTLKNVLDYNFRFSEIDTLASNRYTREVEVPALLATGINYRLAKRHNIMVDLQWRAWDKDVENIAGSWNMPKTTETQTDFMVSLGYQCDGSPLFYESYWNRINYRAGGWYRNWYVKDVFEVGGSLGAGFPLGRKGTTFDMALQGGKRFADTDSQWEEMFIGLRIGLTGIATWGMERR
jgi:long-chain fatty acid transport protein